MEKLSRKEQTELRAAFLRLVEIEPDLAELATDIEYLRKNANGKLRLCANAYWYGDGELKKRMSKLVGWGARNPELRDCLPMGNAPYDIAYDYLYRRLPDCRNCCCWGTEPNEDEIEQARANPQLIGVSDAAVWKPAAEAISTATAARKRVKAAA